MIPLYLGPPERLMFAALHPAQAPAREDLAVLLCNPFGQEAMRSHRLYRVLADRLAQKGLATMRFDYHGTGDSPGADEDGDLEGWIGDVRSACTELARRSGARRIACVGARLGAVLAVRGAAGPDLVSRWVLFDPVVDGRDYLAQLRVKHVESLEASYSRSDPAWRRDLENDPLAFTNEALGFGLSASLRQQLLALGPHSLALPGGADVQIIAHPEDPAARKALERLLQCDARVRLLPLEATFDWTAEERRNSPLVPPQALQLLLSTLCD